MFEEPQPRGSDGQEVHKALDTTRGTGSKCPKVRLSLEEAEFDRMGFWGWTLKDEKVSAWQPRRGEGFPKSR